MGLTVSHNCWDGAYSAFMRWRKQLATVAGLPPLELMEGFFSKDQAVTGNPFYLSYESDKRSGYDGGESIWSRLPIRWQCLKPDPLYLLLYHSDCEGDLDWKDCRAIADSLEKLISKLPKGDGGGHIGNWRDTTSKFAKGLRAAHKAKENVEFS